MKFSILLITILCIISLSCKENSAPIFGSCTPAGRYFNRTVLDKCPAAMPVDVPHYALELTFSAKDTVDIFNGIEKYTLPYSSTDKKCEFRINGASLFGEMYFTVDQDSTVMLYDTAWTKLTTPSTFKLAELSNRSEWEFETFINECVIAGAYVIIEDDKTKQVMFLPNGQVTGLKNFLSYKLCFSGDCLEETEPRANTIDFFTDKGTTETYAFKMLSHRKNYQFHSIGDPIPDIKGGRSIGPMVFEIMAPKRMD